jgi:hypothetical protein
VACVVVALDMPAFERREQEEAARRTGVGWVSGLPQVVETATTAQQWRALRHALAEFDIAVYRVGPTTPLAEALAS